MLIDRSKWKQLLDNIEATLKDVATLPPGPVTANSLAEREANRANYAGLVSRMKTPIFDRSMSNEEFWNKLVAIPYWTNRPPAMGERIAATVKHMVFSGEWLNPGPERNAMLADPLYYERGQRREVVEEALRKVRDYIRLNPGKTIVDYYVLSDSMDEPSLKEVHDLVWKRVDCGSVTAFHIMMELGFPVLKPDAVVALVAVRLGLIRRYEKVSNRGGSRRTTTIDIPANLPQGRITSRSLSDDVDFGWALQRVIKEMSTDTGRSFREIDRLLVKLGAQAKPADGLVQTICGEEPQCHICLANSICAFGKFNRKEAKKRALALAA